MKRAITLIMAILMLATSCFALSGCFKVSDIKTIGDFIFRYKEDSTAARLIKLSKQGKEKTTLVIPSHLPDGLPVTRMGNDGLFGIALGGNIVSDKLVKLFVPNTIATIEGRLPKSLEYLVWDCNEALIEQVCRVYSLSTFYRAIVVVNSQSYDKLVEELKELKEQKRVPTERDGRIEYFSKIENKFKQPNVEFYLNYETENPLFWFDYETGEYVQRHYQGTYVPTREGYTFAGWYKEPECINDWNFDIDKMPVFENQGSIVDIIESIDEINTPKGAEYLVFIDELLEQMKTLASKQGRVRLYAKWEQS